MTYEEAKKALNSFKEKGRSEEDIAKTLYLMFVNDDIDVHDLGVLLGIVGYELTDEFLNMSPEDQKTKVLEDDNEDSEEDSKEETTEKTAEEEKPETDNKDSVDEPKEPVEKIEKDDTQEEKALKLFGLK